jgi:hypothetical protein
MLLVITVVLLFVVIVYLYLILAPYQPPSIITLNLPYTGGNKELEDADIKRLSYGIGDAV